MNSSAYVPSVPLNSESDNPLQHLLLVAELEPMPRGNGGLLIRSSKVREETYYLWVICRYGIM